MGKNIVLIVEDEVLIALGLKMELKRVGCEVLGPVIRGSEAVALAQHGNPDFILIDIGLVGEIDGIEAARQIGEFSPARVIFTTGHADRDLEKRAMALNPLAYLVKPVDIDEILAVMEQNS